MGFHNYNIKDNTYIPSQFTKTTKNLEPGIYKFKYDYEHEMGWFEKNQFQCDEIVDLPSLEYTQLVKEMDVFLDNKTREKFDKFGFLYKRSTLLFGSHGVGKTILVNRLAKQVVDKGGIIIFNPRPEQIEFMFNYLQAIEPNTLTLIVLEEVDTLIDDGEESLLSLLDGEIQKPNTMYIATTNFINRIPKRLCRPGRFSTIIEVKYPSLEARTEFLKHKKLPKSDVIEIARVTDGFSIDELKEVVLSTQCLGIGLEKIVNRVRATKKMTEDLPDDALESAANKHGEAQIKASTRLRNSMRPSQRR